ncbi:hypothetical protein MGYG_07192 [Nannizzia gypsea CBS 118893]|uniref:Piwi domain-containing protein n=1 Tax=Arthroderma gypseum (strain ATCC MYA-4604 / CBS 118893) TaxID=535722 RepID=E4V2C0_ARTGP|nr:hypothetical protein MGYG_07192 [Nannizzia gypsea CBS 118893]EFR04185.1 hypothetical protein MGYG_07192 [Nannizzia gypsea CBS 118893]
MPEKIIVYRDCVSESQYKQVLDTELPAIEDAIYHYYRNGKCPKVTLIIVGKRHRTRFYPVQNEPLDENSENVLPGTVVIVAVPRPGNLTSSWLLMLEFREHVDQHTTLF